MGFKLQPKVIDMESQPANNGILSLAIRDKAVLQAAHMPFIQNGGLFVPTSDAYELGDEVFVLLTLPGEPSGPPNRIPLADKVVWITPPDCEGQRVAGIGVQFSEPDNPLAAVVKDWLGDAPPKERETHTL